MSNSPGRRLLTGLRRHRRRAGIAVVTTAVVAAGLGTAPTASSAPDSACPDVFPKAELVDGDTVTGLTVSEGTTPDEFTGEYLGRIRGGIAPGIDMILARLSSDAIDQVGGIWSGMSGSPVYAEDGRLIGAVSYGLAWGPSPIAGITPAQDMYDLLKLPATNTTARRTLDAAAESDEVDVPQSLTRELVAAGASSADVDGGMSRLPLPLGISGLTGGKRMNQVKKALDLDGTRVYRAGAVSGAATPEPLVAGGNLAASLSYGDLSAVGVGTATAICGDKVIAFGHPMTWSGPSQLSMHNARAIVIQEDSLGAPFKIANATRPVGRVDQDRLAGILGVEGTAAIPDTSDVSSYVTVPGEKSRRGSTHISLPEAVPDLAAFHLLANEDRVFDGISGGSSAVSWTVTLLRADGTKLKYTRSDRYANQYDISFEPVWEIYEQLWMLQNNEVEDVEFAHVHETANMTRAYRAYEVSRVHVLQSGKWVPLNRDKTMRVKAGTEKKFRVTLTSKELATKVVYTKLPIPKRAARHYGYIRILGGNDYYGGGFEEEFFGEGVSSASPSTLEGLVKKLANSPRNDQLLATINLFEEDGSIRRTTRKNIGTVVGGGVTVEVRGVR